MSDTIPASVIAEARGKNSLGGFYVTTDLGGTYNVIAVVEGQIIVEDLRGKTLGRVTQTGFNRIRDMVRVQVEFATDLGDAEGTLSFTKLGGVVGGRANYRLFEAQEC